VIPRVQLPPQRDEYHDKAGERAEDAQPEGQVAPPALVQARPDARPPRRRQTTFHSG
jgi:hypothetical protein